jgi:hypothetical protein
VIDLSLFRSRLLARSLARCRQALHTSRATLSVEQMSQHWPTVVGTLGGVVPPFCRAVGRATPSSAGNHFRHSRQRQYDVVQLETARRRLRPASEQSNACLKAKIAFGDKSDPIKSEEDEEEQEQDWRLGHLNWPRLCSELSSVRRLAAWASPERFRACECDNSAHEMNSLNIRAANAGQARLCSARLCSARLSPARHSTRTERSIETTGTECAAARLLPAPPASKRTREMPERRHPDSVAAGPIPGPTASYLGCGGRPAGARLGGHTDGQLSRRIREPAKFKQHRWTILLLALLLPLRLRHRRRHLHPSGRFSNGQLV